MSAFRSLLSLALLLPGASFAVDAAKLDIVVNGAVMQHVALRGPNAGVNFKLDSTQATELQIRLVAPEPLILDLREVTGDAAESPSVARITLVEKGEHIPLQSIKGTHFSHPYEIVRPE